MAALAEITLEEHELCCRGSEIIPATLFPAETSCRIPVRMRGCVKSYMGPKFRVELSLWISCHECGQELVDPIEARAVPSFGSCDHDRPTREKWRKRLGKILLS